MREVAQFSTIVQRVMERTNLRGVINEVTKTNEIQTRRSAFRVSGFSDIWIDALQKRKISLYTPTVLSDHLRALQERGFDNPQALVRSHPTILSYTRGNIDAKLAGLKERGFINPQKMIESKPAILGYALESIDTKLAGLKERGFTNPRKMIESNPSILGYALESIDTKLAGLKERGFTNPRKMIETTPSIVGLSFKNIDRRLKLVHRLIALHYAPFTASELMENSHPLLTSKVDKLIILTRVLRKIIHRPQDLTSAVINGLLYSNMEDVLMAVDSLKKGDVVTPHQFLRRVREAKSLGLPKEEKRERIVYGMPNDTKIKQRYLRAYPTRERRSAGHDKIPS